MAGREPHAGKRRSSCDLRMRARSLCNAVVKDVKVANTIDAEKDGVLNDSHWRLQDGAMMIMDTRHQRQVVRQVAQIAGGNNWRSNVC